MAETVSSYELKNKRRTLLGELNGSPKTENEKSNKDKFKSTAEGLGRDLILGVIGGGLAGAILGRYSFVLGLGVAGLGHYSENKMLSALGLGMMATGTYQALTGKEQDPSKPLMEKVTERVEAFKSDFKRKLWIDKFNEKKEVKKKEENKTEDDLNGLKSPRTQAQPAKEKEVNLNKTDISDLSQEDQEYLEKEINAMVDEKIDEFMNQKKNTKTSTASNSNAEGMKSQKQGGKETTTKSLCDKTGYDNYSANHNENNGYENKGKGEIESWDDIERIM